MTPGKFCPGIFYSWNYEVLENSGLVRKLSWNFPKRIPPKMDIPGTYSSGIFHSWNLFLSWNFLFLESYFTEFSCLFEKRLKD